MLSKQTYWCGMRSMGSVVSIATRVWTVGSVFESRRGQEIFLFSKTNIATLGTPKTSIQCVPRLFFGSRADGAFS